LKRSLRRRRGSDLGDGDLAIRAVKGRRGVDGSDHVWILADESALFTLAWCRPLWICGKASATFSVSETLP
jgi:hypothetical protein